MAKVDFDNFTLENFEKINPVFSKNTLVGDIIEWFDDEPEELFVVTQVIFEEEPNGKEYLTLNLQAMRSGMLYKNLTYYPGSSSSMGVYQYRRKTTPFSDEELSEIFV